MSDAKKFALKTPLTAEERLDEVERKYEVIRERIQAYDEVLNQFASLKSEVKQANKNAATLLDKYETLSKELKGAIGSLSDQLKPLKNAHESHSSVLSDQGAQLTSLKIKTAQNHSDVKSLVDEANSRMASISLDQAKLSDGVNEWNRKASDIQSKSVNHSNNLEKLYADYFKFKDECISQDEYLSKDIKRVRQIIENFPDLQEWANKIYSRVQSDLTYRDKQASLYVDKKVDGVAQELAANPLSAESIKNSLFNEIQALGLDGKNAYIKASNCATQIQLFEKKLENLSLLIKKYELNK